jgi:hypothetical protein
MNTCAREDAEPRLDAPIEVWRSWIRDLVRGNQFTSRRWSWVCVRERYFLKIPRVCGRLETDLSAGIAEAEREYRLTQHLSRRLEGMVDRPLRLSDACMVNRRLSGPDLWRMAEREGGTPEVQAGISQGLVLAAKLHRLDPKEVPGLPVHDYANDPHLPAPDAVNDRLCQRPRVIVLGGLEVRNFKLASTDGQWRFFDPHDAVLGAPEDDFARYVLSLLMITWGRHARCRVWTRFDYPQLVQAYEAARGAPLDQGLLPYMFQLNVARRRSGARRSTRRLPWFMRMAARSYEELFFRQVQKWLRQI